MEETGAVTALQFKDAMEKTKCKMLSSQWETCSQFLIYSCTLIMCWWRDPQSTRLLLLFTSLLCLLHSCQLLNAAVFIFILAKCVCLLRKLELHNMFTLTGCADSTNLCLYAAGPLSEFSLLPTFTHYECISDTTCCFLMDFFPKNKKMSAVQLWKWPCLHFYSLSVSALVSHQLENNTYRWPRIALSLEEMELGKQILKIKFSHLCDI